MQVSVKQIQDENRQLLVARRFLLDSRSSSWLLREEAAVADIYGSLCDEEIQALGELEFPLFVLSCPISDLKDVAINRLNIDEMEEGARIAYESNLLWLSNRWQKSESKKPDEIRFNTKSTVYEALNKLTFSQIQEVARRPGFVSKIAISSNVLMRLVHGSHLSQEEKNCILVTG